jgi:tetratricopeptide (TPR) repeat protein
MAEAVGERRVAARSLAGLGWATLYTEPALSRTRFERAIPLARELGDTWTLNGSLQGLSLALLRTGDLDEARRRVSQSIDEAGDLSSVNSLDLVTLGAIEARQGQEASALRRYAQALRNAQSAGGHIELAITLDAIAHSALVRGDLDRGARLSAAADRLRREIGGGPSITVAGWEEPLDEAGRGMDPGDFQAAVAKGRALTNDEAVALGLEVSNALAAPE